MGEPVYFWFYVCKVGCSHERTSTEPLGLPSWNAELCPTVGCGQPIFEVNMKGPEEPPAK